MKKIIAVVLIVALIVFLFVYPIVVLESNVALSSNVPVHLEKVLRKIGPFYLSIAPLENVQIFRHPFKIEVKYEEKPLLNIKFKNGEFGITENGFLIVNTGPNLPNVIANFSSSFYNEEMGNFLIYCMENNFLGFFKQLELIDQGIAFTDKNAIFVIIGKGDFELKMKEYNKVIEVLSKDLKAVKSIDLRYNLQAVVKWRGNG